MFNAPNMTPQVGLLLLLGLVGSVLSGRSEFELKMFESGREQYEMVHQKSSLPRQGDCWKGLIQNLHSGCDKLDEDQHAKLALGLADCFLEMSGEQRHSCGSVDSKEERKQCSQKMPERAFNVYSKFFTHVANMCYFLKSSVWQELAQNTIDSLLSVSQLVDGQLRDIKDKNEKLMEIQHKSISLQEQAINSGASLGEVLQESRASVALMMTEIKENTMEQQLALIDLSQRLSALQAWAIGEVSWLESLAYFAIAVCTAYLTTAWSRAIEARGWIFVLLFLGVLSEQAIFKIILSHHEGGSAMFHKENLYFWVWKLRYLVVVLCASVYVYCIVNFVDYPQVNHQLLSSIHNMVKDMQSASSMVVTTASTMNGNPTIRSAGSDEESQSEAETTERNRRETSVTFVRVEQKTYSTRSNTPLRSTRRAMAILEVNEGESPSGGRYNLRSATPVKPQ